MAAESSTADTLNVLLEHKLMMLATIADTTMSWWTTAIVFSAAAIGLFWLNREHLIALPGLNWVCTVVTVFLASFPIYGGFIIWRTRLLRNEVADLLKTLGHPTIPLEEFRTVMFAVGLGVFTFLIVLVLWISIWKYLPRPAPQDRREDGL